MPTSPPPGATWPSPPPWPVSEPPSGNGGTHGDLRERVRALEVQSHMHHVSTVERLRAQVDRIAGIDRRLEQGDQRMTGLQARITAHDEAIRRHGEAISPLAVAICELREWQQRQEATQAHRATTKEERRAARRDALALVQWAGALLLMAAYALGAIGADKVDGLLKLKSLAP